MGLEYISTFIAPTRELARRIKEIFPKTLGIACMVLVIGDRYALDAVRQMSDVVMENDLFRSLFLGLPRLTDDRLQDLIDGMESDAEPYQILFKPRMRPLLEAIIDPSPETLAEPSGFHNVYEETKHRGERMAVKRCENGGIRFRRSFPGSQISATSTAAFPICGSEELCPACELGGFVFHGLDDSLDKIHILRAVWILRSSIYSIAALRGLQKPPNIVKEETDLNQRPIVRNRRTHMSNCERCKFRKNYDRNPRSFLGRLWKWHTRWCPGWKGYLQSLPEEKRDAVLEKYR